MSFSAHSAFLCDRLLNMFCSAAYKLDPPFGHIKVELCPGLESNSWTKSAKPQCLCGIILFVLLYRNHRSGARFRLPSYSENSFALFCISATLFSANSGSLCRPCRLRALPVFRCCYLDTQFHGRYHKIGNQACYFHTVSHVAVCRRWRRRRTGPAG